MIKYTITGKDEIPANLHLIDSYTVSKKNFQGTLNRIRAIHPKSEVWNRCDAQMKLEWATHNAAYDLHIFRSHTKDCDLDYPQCFLVRAFYAVVGCLVWLFIK